MFLLQSVISSAFFNIPGTEEQFKEIEEISKEQKFFDNKPLTYSSIPLGIAWCLRHDIKNVDILVSVSLFKQLLNSEIFHKKIQIVNSNSKNMHLFDCYKKWPLNKHILDDWVNRFIDSIYSAIATAKKWNNKEAGNAVINIPSIATNYPNLSNASELPEANELWRRSVFALACCMVAAHRIKEKQRDSKKFIVIEIVAGSILDRIEDSQQHENGDQNIWLLRIHNKEEETRSKWKKQLGIGVLCAYILASYCLSVEGSQEICLPDVSLAVEFEPEPYRLTNSPKEWIDVVRQIKQQCKEFSIEEIKKVMGIIFEDVSSDYIIKSSCTIDGENIEKINAFIQNFCLEKRYVLASRVGYNLDCGHIAMYLSKYARTSATSCIRNYDLSNYLHCFLPSNHDNLGHPDFLNVDEQTEFWDFVFHSHVSDHGITHNKDQTPLSVLTKEFYLSLLYKYKKICETVNLCRSNCVSLELEAASRTEDIYVGYHTISELLTHIP